MKIFTKFICLLIVAISLLTGCDIENKCSCIEIENKCSSIKIKNNVRYFKGVNLSNSFKNGITNTKIINSSQELRDIFYKTEINQDVYPDAKEIIKMYDDDFFNENALVAIAIWTGPDTEVKVTSFEPKNNKLKITVESISEVALPGTSSILVVKNHLILIETTKEEIKDCTDVEVTENEVSVCSNNTDCSK